MLSKSNMEDEEREEYENRIKELSENVKDLSEQLEEALGLLKEISNMTR